VEQGATDDAGRVYVAGVVPTVAERLGDRRGVYAPACSPGRRGAVCLRGPQQSALSTREAVITGMLRGWTRAETRPTTEYGRDPAASAAYRAVARGCASGCGQIPSERMTGGG
jgi:hypothetical protein